jgi:hypothetical protein
VCGCGRDCARGRGHDHGLQFSLLENDATAEARFLTPTYHEGTAGK